VEVRSSTSDGRGGGPCTVTVCASGERVISDNAPVPCPSLSDRKVREEVVEAVSEPASWVPCLKQAEALSMYSTQYSQIDTVGTSQDDSGSMRH
jgi:hypothetical protein